jgi:hypothetical protein
VAIEGETRGIILGGSAIYLDMSFWPYGFTIRLDTHTLVGGCIQDQSYNSLIKDEKNHLQIPCPLPVCM